MLAGMLDGVFINSTFLCCIRVAFFEVVGEVVKFLLDDLVGTVCFKTCHSLVVPHQVKYYAISFLKSLTSKWGTMNFFPCETYWVHVTYNN